MSRNVNGPTPSEFSHGRGHRPSLDLYPAGDPELDQLGLKRMQMQVDNLDPNATIDPTGEYQGYDQYGRPLATMQERGYTPLVREDGRGEMDDRLDPTNPYLYEQREGKGANPNEAWRDDQVSDPVRTGWENGNYDPNINEKTAAYQHGVGENSKRDGMITSVRDKAERIVKRTPEYKYPVLKNKGEPDPRDL